MSSKWNRILNPMMRGRGMPVRIILAIALAGSPLLDDATLRAADMPAKPKSAPRDVSLDPDGTLVGQFLNTTGHPVAHTAIEARQGIVVRQAVTDEHGWFRFESMSGGTMLVTTPERIEVIRVWAPGTAPPIADHRLLLVAEGPVTRGQRPISELFLSDQLLAGVIVAAAIAVPIAVHNSKKERRNGS